MLILSRKPNEKIIIGDGIEVMVLSVRGNQVRLGVNAPDNVKVIREELQGKPFKDKKPIC